MELVGNYILSIDKTLFYEGKKVICKVKKSFWIKV